MTVSIVVDYNHFGRIASNMQGALDDALGTAALTIVAVADPLTAVDTGSLRGNKTIQRDASSVTVTWNQSYAGYVELGTVHMSPQPFARPGLEAAEPQFLASLARLIEGG